MKKLSLLIIFSLLTFFLFAREVAIYVMDIDLDLPLEGAQVRVWDGNLFTADKDGKVVIDVPDRQVIIQAAYPGYETGRIVVPVTGSTFTIQLRLSGIMQSRELVIEAARPGTSDSRTGRSVSVGEREIAQTAEMGVIEDVMSTIKLLPGVSYTGTFGTQPSIRGGYPGDMNASLDGFYINNPYHWGGVFSIFDPRMVQSAQLSHGVFSTRYGNTISGLLDITSKKPSSTETQFELGASSSAANVNLSFPFNGKGGLNLMGRVTFYDPVVALAKLLSGAIPQIEMINSVRTAPYIRSGTITSNYRFTENLEMIATGFFGMDGVGVKFENIRNTGELKAETILDFDYLNILGFLTTSLFWNPHADMLLKLTVGVGYEGMNVDGDISNIITKHYSPLFITKYFKAYPPMPPSPFIKDPYSFDNNMLIIQNDSNLNAQGRIDYDWQISNNFLISAGIQEMYNRYTSKGEQDVLAEIRFKNLDDIRDSHLKNIITFWFSSYVNQEFFEQLRISFSRSHSPNVHNNLFSSSGYVLTEFNTNDNRFNAELGLRADHFFLSGAGFSASSNVTLNPRLNLDYVILKDKGFLESLSISLGTGLFSSMNSNVFVAEERYNVSRIKPNRSWTSILGFKFEFPESLSLNIEAYYKRVFDRMYITVNTNPESGENEINPRFDGRGIVWGIDVMIHKIQSRYWDGWISYSYNWSKYRDPHGQTGGMGISGGNRGNDWYFPGYHRFHTLNLVINYRPTQNINLYLRFGIASGALLSRRVGNGPVSSPVLVYDQNNPGSSYLIEKYYWESYIDENNRTTPSLPMDIKFSVFGTNRTGKTRWELYVAVENVLALLYTSQGNTSFNQYTGYVDQGSSSANYELPIPIPSIGFKISY